MSNLTEQVAAVHQARQRAFRAQATIDEEYALWLAEHQEPADDLKDAKEAVAAAEAALREMTLAAYTATGNKQPAPGVGIRVVQRLDYEPMQALVWAKAHDIGLALNKVEFERMAKITLPDFVTITDQPTATIATDLSEAVRQGEAQP